MKACKPDAKRGRFASEVIYDSEVCYASEVIYDSEVCYASEVIYDSEVCYASETIKSCYAGLDLR